MKKLICLAILIYVFPSLAQFNSVWDKVSDQVRSKNAFKRFEWFYRPRTDEKGIYPKEHIEEQKQLEMQKLSRLEKNSYGITGTSNLWTNLGPRGINMSSSFIPYWGVCSGRERGLAVHPTDPSTVYIGAADGGIWKTTDGGSSWSDLSSQFSHLTFGAIAIDKLNPNNVYAGTGESMWLFNNVTYEGDGLYKTTDGGNNWTRITNGFGTQTQFSDIEVSPSNSSIILASLAAGNWNNAFPTNEGIWRSSDAGVTWTRVLNVQDGFDVAFDPSDASIAYASSGNQTSSAGFYKSTNAGVTWTQNNTGLPSTSSIGRMQFAVAPSATSTIYSLIYNNSVISGGKYTVAYKSINGGANWSQISSGVNIAGSYDGSTINDQGWYDLCLDVNPTNANNVYFGNVEISKTTDGSTISFLRNPSGYNSGVGAWASYTHVDIHKIRYAPSNSNYIYVCCDGGIYRSTDGGTSWSHINNGINTLQFYRVASHPTNANILFGGAQDNGNFSTSDRGASPWVFELSGDGMECFIDYNNANNVFMSTQYGSLYRSTNGGTNWSSLSGVGLSNTTWCAPFWQHPSQPSKLYTAQNLQILRSTNNGTNWSYITSSAISTSSLITSVAQSPVNTSFMIAIASDYTTNPGVYKSTDEGVTWSDISTNVSASFSGTNIQRVVADPVNANTFYICRASYSSGMVIKTTDFGTTWTNISSGLPSVTCNDIFIDPANSSQLYAGNDFGVYWSSNGGTNWTKLSNGMPFVVVQDFSFFNSGGTRYLRAATHGRGIYELNIDSPLPIELKSFTVKSKEGEVDLNWVTATEVNNLGFEIERSVDKNDFMKIGFIKGNGNSNSPKYYSFTDKNANGFLSYRLKQIDIDGGITYSNIQNVESIKISDYAVYQNYPNPFNPITLIKYKVPLESRVQINIFNALGENVSNPLNSLQLPGIYDLPWDGSRFSSGVYFYSVKITSLDGNSVLNKTMKMILTK